MDLQFQRLLNTRDDKPAPVTFEDATGMISHFYTDYVTSIEVRATLGDVEWLLMLLGVPSSSRGSLEILARHGYSQEEAICP
jgi:hypothetical protein